MSIDDALHELAARQHGVFAVEQAKGLGATRTMLRHRLAHHRLDRLTKYVLGIPGAPRTHLQRLVTSVLDAGPSAFLSADAAAATWKISGFSLLHLRGKPDVTRPRGTLRRKSSIARVHEVLDLQPDHTTVLDGIPISTPTRVIFEIAASRYPKRAVRALDSAWAKNLTNRRLLARMLDDWADRGRAGTVLMRELLETRPKDYVPPASNLEARFATLAERFGIGPFRRQVNLGGEAWIGRVDFLREGLPLVVEVLSHEHHAALVDEGTDLHRFETLRQAGFTVASVKDYEIWGNYRPAMERIRRAEAALRRRAA
jgi:very-short-patch-repair endonuclease